MKKILSSLVVILTMAVSFCSVPVFAAGFNEGICNDVNATEEMRETAGCTGGGQEVVGDRVTQILNAIVALTGVISVIVLIICGIYLMTAAGDPSKIAKAKKGILYAIVGLVVSLLAWAIVNFILVSLVSS